MFLPLSQTLNPEILSRVTDYANYMYSKRQQLTANNVQYGSHRMFFDHQMGGVSCINYTRTLIGLITSTVFNRFQNLSQFSALIKFNHNDDINIAILELHKHTCT